ncbi:11573_t:CDS:2, partial [Entrophospora sp. SA101]
YIVNLGIKYNLISKYTSFIVIDEQSKKSISQKPPEIRHVPNKQSLQMYRWHYGVGNSINIIDNNLSTARQSLSFKSLAASPSIGATKKSSKKKSQTLNLYPQFSNTTYNNSQTLCSNSNNISNNNCNDDQNQKEKKKGTTKEEIKEHKKPKIETLLTF